MHEKCTTHLEGKRINRDIKVNRKHENLKHKLNHADTVTSTLISLTADFYFYFLNKGYGINLTYINLSKPLYIMPHQQLLTKQLVIVGK